MEAERNPACQRSPASAYRVVPSLLWAGIISLAAMGLCTALGHTDERSLLWYSLAIGGLASVCGLSHWSATQRASAQRAKDDQHAALGASHEMLRSLAVGTSASTGNDFFRVLVQRLAETFDVKWGFVAELDPRDPSRVRTLAVWGDGSLQENVSYRVAGTPCEDSIAQGSCFVPGRVTDAFPHDTVLRDLGAESYFGVGVYDNDHQPLGVLGVMHEAELHEQPAQHAVMEICANRVVRGTAAHPRRALAAGVDRGAASSQRRTRVRERVSGRGPRRSAVRHPSEERVSGQHEPRDTHADDRHPGLRRPTA